MNLEIIYINEATKALFKKIGCGIIDYITIYRKEGTDWFISAGNGKFKSDEEEIKLFTK